VIAAFSVSLGVTPINLWHPNEECNTFPTIYTSQQDESQEIVEQYIYNWLYYDKRESQHLIASTRENPISRPPWYSKTLE